MIFFSFLIGGLNGKAQQIVLDQNDFPKAGTNLIRLTGSNTSGLNLNDSLSLGSKGANGVYDFSKALPFVVDTVLLQYVTPASTGYGANHPGTDVALLAELDIDSASGDTVLKFYEFYNVDANIAELTGVTMVIDTQGLFSQNPVGLNDTVHLSLAPSDTIADVAFALGFTDTDSSRWEVTLGTVYHDEELRKNIEVDGWGDLDNPWGTFNVLRIKISEIFSGTDSLNGNVQFESDTIHYFEFWAKGINYPILIVATDSSYTFMYEIDFVIVTPISDIPEMGDGRFDVYPNPASEEITLMFMYGGTAERRVEILNAIGQQVYERRMPHGISIITVDVSEFNRGVYFAVIKDTSGNNLYVKRIVISD